MGNLTGDLVRFPLLQFSRSSITDPVIGEVRFASLGHRRPAFGEQFMAQLSGIHWLAMWMI